MPRRDIDWRDSSCWRWLTVLTRPAVAMGAGHPLLWCYGADVLRCPTLLDRLDRGNLRRSQGTQLVRVAWQVRRLRPAQLTGVQPPQRSAPDAGRTCGPAQQSLLAPLSAWRLWRLDCGGSHLPTAFILADTSPFPMSGTASRCSMGPMSTSKYSYAYRASSWHEHLTETRTLRGAVRRSLSCQVMVATTQRIGRRCTASWQLEYDGKCAQVGGRALLYRVALAE